MADVFDVARYILGKKAPMTTMKLQKLVYYCQAWSTVWDSKLIFKDRIEAWASGPVVPSLYNLHKGQFLIKDLPVGDPEKLTKDERETVDAVLETYGDKSAQWLSDLTHMELPWNEAREGIPEGYNCEHEIKPSSLEEYYGALPPGSELV